MHTSQAGRNAQTARRLLDRIERMNATGPNAERLTLARTALTSAIMYLDQIDADSRGSAFLFYREA